MKNLYKYILLSIISGVTLIGVIDYSVKADQKFSPLNISQNTTNTKDLPILQSPIAKQVYDTAKSITVMIRFGDKVGSGVIIAKNGEKYYVLTASHVFQGLLEAEITTTDGKVYPIKINEPEARIGETDLGVLEFSSKENYQVATLASNLLEDRDIIFTYGFPREEVIKGNVAGLFSIGYAISRETSILLGSETGIFNQGYELAYSNLTAEGVSGGPVLDHEGRLFGIHGRVDGDLEDVKSSQMLPVQFGYSIAIPIGYLFNDLAKDKNWRAYLQQDKDKTTILSPDSKRELLEIVIENLKVPTEKNALAWLNYGNQLWRYRKYDLAIDAFEKAISLKSDLYYAYYGKGLALYALKKYEEAIEVLETGINIYNQTGAIDKKFIIACLSWQGRSFDSLLKWKEALRVYEQAIKFDTDKRGYRNFALYFLKGDLLINLKRYEEAISAYSEAIEIKPNYSSPYYNRGTIYANKLKEYEKAISDYSQAISINPQFAEAYNNRGITYDELEKYEEAISDYSQAISINPQSAEAYNNRGEIYNDLKEYEKALIDLNQAISLNPDLVEAYNNRGNTYDELEKYEEAISDYSQAISINPQFAIAYYNRGITYAKLKEYEKAINDYSQAISINPQFAEAYRNRGEIYNELKEYDKAISDYSQAITLNPKSARTYVHRSLIYYILNDKQKAIPDIQQAVKLYCQEGSEYCDTQKIIESFCEQGELYCQGIKGLVQELK